MSARAKAGVFSALSQGLSNITGQISALDAQRKAEEIRKEKEERDRPLRALQLKSAQQSVAAGEREATRQQAIDADEAEFQEILQKIKTKPALQKKFQDEIQKGAEQFQAQQSQQPEEQPQASLGQLEEMQKQPEVAPGPEQAPAQGPVQLTPGAEQAQGQLEMSEAERRLESINKFRGSRSPAIQTELKNLQGQVDRERQEKLALEKEERDRKFKISEREASQDFQTERDDAKREKAIGDIVKKQKGDAVKIEQSLRKELQSNLKVKDFQIIDSKYKGMQAVWNDFQKSGTEDSRVALDQAVITLYNKILDSGSVVRESEYARTEEGQALIERMKGIMPKIKQGGTGLTIKELGEVMDAAKVLRDAAEDGFNVVVGKYGDSIKEYSDIGIDFERVINPILAGTTNIQPETDQEKAEDIFSGSDTLEPGQSAPQNISSFRFDEPGQGATRVGRFIVERE
jgi:hypothetical protein